MIFAETWYKTYNSKLLAIVKVFKIWHHYLKGCKHKIFVLTDHNNLSRFMDTKSLSFKQIRWTQKLSQYHYQINYCQGKANAAANTLSQFLQWSQDKKNKFQVENSQIFYCLQNLLINASLARLSFSFSSSFFLLLHLH